MSDSHCSILIKEKLGHRKAYDIAATDHHGTFARYLYTSLLEHLDYALWSAWKYTVLLLPESSYIKRMETVNILLL